MSNYVESLPILLILLLTVDAQDVSSGLGNIVMEQDPRQQDPFYRDYYARAGGLPLASVNSVVHNVKHQSEGHFKIWDDLPSHKVRPGYSTTTKAPKITTTSSVWVRGRPRAGAAHHQQAWHQQLNDPEGYYEEGGADYEEPPRNYRGRGHGRRPPGSVRGRGRRPPAPTAPVRVNSEDLVDNADGGGDFAGAGEGTRQDSEGKKGSEEGEGTKKPETDIRKAPEKKENDDEGTRQEAGGGGEANGEIDLADVKKSGIQNLRKTPPAGNKKKEDKDDGEGTKKKKKKEEEEEEEEEDEDEEGTKKKKKKEKKKKGGKKDKKEKKKGKKKKSDEDEDEEDGDGTEEDDNGELKKVEGEVKIPKSVDGDAEGHDDEDYEDEDDNDRKKKSKKKDKHRRTKDSDEEEDDTDFDDEDEDDEEEEEHKKRKSKKKCRPYQAPPPPNRAPYPSQYPFGYTWPVSTTTTSTLPPIPYQQRLDGYTYQQNDFELMDCSVNENDEDEEEDEDRERRKKKKKSKKNKKRGRKSKKGKKGGKHRNHDFLGSREMDQRGHFFDELNDNDDLKKLRKHSEPSPGGIDCFTAVDEFPLKCDAWKSAGFCETNQATQFLWCRKTCLCSKPSENTTTISTTTMIFNRRSRQSTDEEEDEE